MSNETIPLNLFKANLELQLRLQRLMQENGQQWLENATRAGSENIAESGTEIESLLKAQNWQELATLPAQAFWRQFQYHVGGAQALTQVAIKNQTTFTQGLQQAIQDWQKSVTQAVGQADAILPFQDIFKQWGAVWAKAQDKAQTANAATEDVDEVVVRGRRAMSAYERVEMIDLLPLQHAVGRARGRDVDDARFRRPAAHAVAVAQSKQRWRRRR